MKDGSYFEGEFKNGEISGKGVKFNTTSGSEYIGVFVNGQLEGKGKVKSSTTEYEGELHENMRHGYGEMNELKLNRSYKGQWYMNKRHGLGEQRYADGAVYDGYWVHDKRQGHGVIKYSDSSYEGQWRNDMHNGQGIYNHLCGYSYEGIFENNKPYRLVSKLVVSVNQTEIEESETSFNVEVKSLSENNKIFVG